MKSPEGDPELLLRAAGRCLALAGELDRAGTALSRASAHVAPHWAGAGADAFDRAVGDHRGTLTSARQVLERLGALSRSLAHELADEQQRARRGGDPAAAEGAEARIAILRKGFRQQLAQLEGDLNALLLRAPITWPPPRTGPPRFPGLVDLWRPETGPPRFPGLIDLWRPRTGPPRWRGPVRPLPGDPPRWTGPPRVTPPLQRLPVDPPRWTGPVRPPFDLHGAGSMTVQPVGV